MNIFDTIREKKAQAEASLKTLMEDYTATQNKLNELVKKQNVLAGQITAYHDILQQEPKCETAKELLKELSVAERPL